MSNNDYLITEEGLKALKEELEFRVKVKREELKNTVEETREHGDISENEGFEMAKVESASNEQRIKELEELIKNSKIVKQSAAGSKSVTIGSTVKLKNGKEQVYTIVGENEANPMEGKISHKSPIGEQLIGKKEGDKITIETPNGQVHYTIVEIS